MPPRTTCECGDCPVCRKREWFRQRRRGIRLTAEQRSERARNAVLARWAKTKPPMAEHCSPEVSDEELDRRALEMEKRWNA